MDIFGLTVADLFSVLALSGAVLAVIIPYWIFRKDLRERVFFEYTSRYREIMSHLPSNVFSRECIPEELQKEDHNIRWLKSYFDLCSEEVKLRIRHKMPNETWNDWEEAMREAMVSPVGKWARSSAGFDKDFRTLRSFLDGRDRGLELARKEFTRRKEWSDGQFH